MPSECTSRLARSTPVPEKAPVSMVVTVTVMNVLPSAKEVPVIVNPVPAMKPVAVEGVASASWSKSGSAATRSKV